jgi:DNA-3-methyladenine glycosylase
VLSVAPDLLGCEVWFEGCAGRIVETEAYHFSEPAAHSFVGITPRTVILHGAPGTAYIYRSYGIHALLNAVCEPEGVGAAVLIRALEPLEGLEAMAMRRGGAAGLSNGPGKLTQALGISLAQNGTSLVGGPIRIVRGAPLEYVVGPRIGITKAADLPWRFCALGSRDVSRPWPPGFRASLAA